MGVILLMIGSHKEHIASGSVTNVGSFNEIGQEVQEKLHSQKLVIIGRRTEMRTEWNLRPSLVVYTKRNAPSALLVLHMPAIIALELFCQSS